MIVWNVTLYEPLPINGDGVRPMRSGLLTNALLESGHEVELWLPGFEHVHHYQFRKDSAREKVNDKFHIQYIKGCGYERDTSPRRFLHNRQIAREFYRLAKKRRVLPDVIISQIPALELAESVINFGKLNSIPVVVDIRDLWPDVYKRFFPERIDFIYKLIFFREIIRLRHILKHATGITAVSKEFLEWAITHAKRAKTNFDRVFHIGYPSEKQFRKLTVNEETYLENKYQIDTRRRIVFFAGTFCESYDLDTVFEGAAIIEQSGYSDVLIVIAGGGQDQEQIRRRCQERKNVSYVGWLDGDDLELFLNLAQVGLAPYSKNALMSLPNKPFEYMAASLPILNSLKGELHQMIIDKRIGINYQAGDPASLAEAIASLCDIPQTINVLGNNAKMLYDQKFDSENIYLKFVKYIEVVGHESGRT